MQCFMKSKAIVMSLRSALLRRQLNELKEDFMGNYKLTHLTLKNACIYQLHWTMFWRIAHASL